MNASGHDSHGNGLSSIAVLVNSSTVTLRRCSLTAGNGDDGLDAGAPTPNYTGTIAQDGFQSNGPTGGGGGVASCADGTGAVGGRGGDGANNVTQGTDGTSQP